MSNLPFDIQTWVEEQRKSKTERYKQASFLKNDYNAPVWVCAFGNDRRFEVDWRVELADGSLLTEKKNVKLWDAFRMLLCVQAHADASGSFERGSTTIYQHVRCAMWVVDYFLLNDASLELHRYALSALTATDVERMLFAFAAAGTNAEGVYEWSGRLSDYLRRESETVTWDDICRGVKHSRDIVKVSVAEDERELALSERELVYARFWLLRERLWFHVNERLPYGIRPNTLALTSRIYSNTIAGKVKRPIPEELCWVDRDSYTCEYPRSPVQAGAYERDQPCSVARMKMYLRIVKCLRLVSAGGCTVPQAALRALTSARAELLVVSPNAGHFIIPLANNINFALEKAISFFKEYVADIFSSYASVIQGAIEAGESCRVFATGHRVKKLLEKGTGHLGVEVWSLARSLGKPHPRANRLNIRVPASRFFSGLRKNEGLVELTQIALGACLLIVGAITGRRQGELHDLPSDGCIDQTRQLLVFANRKSGVLGIRNVESRPIHPLGIEVIRCIQGFHSRLLASGAIEGTLGLFSTMTEHGTCVLSHTSMNRLLDRFFDYIEMPVSADGTRPYLRQHQLRRFFVTDYYRRRSGSLSTLSWYLGHRHLRQVDAYIEIDFGREELERVQAHVAVERLQQSTDSPFEKLRDLIEVKFGTRTAVIEEAEAVEAFLASKRHDPKYRVIDETFNFRGVGELSIHCVKER